MRSGPAWRRPRRKIHARNSTSRSAACDSGPTNVETASEPAAAEATHEPAKVAEPAKAEASAPVAKPEPRATKLPASAQIDDLFAAVRRLEAFASDEAKRVSGKLVPTVEDHARKNIWVSLLLALGLGLILGIWLTGGRRRD